MPINGEGRSGERRSPERAFVHPPARIGETAPVARQHLDISEQMVAESDRLRRLQMGEAGHHGGGLRQRLFGECALQIRDLPIDLVQRVAHPQAHVGRDLIIARAGGVKPARRLADNLLQPAFDIHVDVFKRAREGKLAGLDLGLDLFQPPGDCCDILTRENAGFGEHGGMGKRAADILPPELLIEADGSVDLFHDLGGACLEAPAPHPVAHRIHSCSNARRHKACARREKPMANMLAATPLLGLHAVAVDSETTGLDVRKARMIEFAAIPIENGVAERAAAWVTLIACGEPIPPASQAVHGISDADLIGQPDFAGAAPGIAAQLKDKVLIGHTIGFDLALLEQEHKRAGLPFQRPIALDVRHLAQIVAPNLPGYSLEALAAWLDVKVQDRHRAMGDAEAAAHIFIGLIPKLREAGYRTLGETLAACKRATDGPAGGAPAEWDLNDANAALLRSGPGRVAIKLDGYPYRHRVSELMTRDPFTLPCAKRVRETLALMVEKRISSVLVSDQPGATAETGILTERDIMRALAKYGAAALDLSIGELATRPLITVPDDALLYRAIGRMTNRNLRHLVATGPDGEVSGIVSARDLLRLRASASIALGDDIDAAPDAPRLAKAWAKLPAMAAALTAEEVPARDVAAVIAREIGALTRRAAQLAEAEMLARGEGAPPCAYAVLVLGSAGRGESLLAMDQDNALIFAEGEPDSAADRWFAAMAARMNTILHEVGVPLCKGGVMAREPAFRGSLETWRGRVRRWLGRSSPEDMLAVDIFFDFRAVHGDFSLAHALWREAWDAVKGEAAFLKLLAGEVEEGGAPLSFFGKLKAEEDGRIDLKRHGLKRLVTSARVLAMRHHVARHATHDRLAGIIALKVAGEAELQRLDHDHAVVLDAILRQQLADIAEGRPPGNRVALKPLTREQIEALTQAMSRQSDIAELLRAQLSG